MKRIKIEITLIEDIESNRRGFFSQLNRQFFSVETTRETQILTLEIEECRKLELIDKVIKVAGLGQDKPSRDLTPEEIDKARGMVNVHRG